MTRIIHGAAIVLENDQQQVLLGQRPEGKSFAGMFEFPGGKLEPGETPEQALVREIEEELAVKVDEASLEPVHFVSHAYPDFHLVMTVFRSTNWQGPVNPQENQSFVWVDYDALPSYVDKVPGANIGLLHYVAALGPKAAAAA